MTIRRTAKAAKPPTRAAKPAPQALAPKMPKAEPVLPHPWVRVTMSALARSKLKSAGVIPNPFELDLAKPPPGVVPRGAKRGDALAMDSMTIEANAWAAQQVYNGAFFNGVTFMGYPYLSELTQRPEYRRITEVLATAMTKNWIKFQSTADDGTGTNPKIVELQDECERLSLVDAFRTMVELDGFFGRAHLYLDTGDTDTVAELPHSIGDGRDAATLAKFGGRRGFLKALQPVEPVWCYPAKYEASDPLHQDWYNPQSWFVMGKEVHVSRLLTFVGRKVPDLLKPSYAFGGLSMSQMAKPYVDNWLRTRQAVADLIWSFSVRGLKTNMSAMMGADGNELMNRVQYFTTLQNNQGLMALDKETEDFFNITTPLSSLNDLQAQAQEHMCSVTGTPVVVLLGIQPAGLNASSAGEMDTWDSWVEAYQEKFFTRKLDTVLNFIQLSLWGEIDPDITYVYEPLRSLGAKDLAEKQYSEAQRDTAYTEAGILDPTEVRRRLAADPTSKYDGLNVDDLPEQGEANPEDMLDIGGAGQFGFTREAREDHTREDPARDPAARAATRAGADRPAARPGDRHADRAARRPEDRNAA